MQDWEKTNYEVYLELQHSQETELMHHRTKGALNKKIAEYRLKGGKLINGKIVYAKNAARKASDNFVKNVDKHLDRYNYHNSKAKIYNVYDGKGRVMVDHKNDRSKEVSKTEDGSMTILMNRNSLATKGHGKMVSDADNKRYDSEVNRMDKEVKNANSKYKDRLKRQRTKDKLKTAIKSTGYAIKDKVLRYRYSIK